MDWTWEGDETDEEAKISAEASPSSASASAMLRKRAVQSSATRSLKIMRMTSAACGATP